MKPLRYQKFLKIVKVKDLLDITDFQITLKNPKTLFDYK